MCCIAVVRKTKPKSIYPPRLVAMLAGDRRRADPRRARKPAHGSDDIDDENDGKLRALARLPWRLRTFFPLQF